MDEAVDHLLDDMDDDKQDRQHEGFEEDRIDERPAAEPAAGVPGLEQKHHLGEHEGVDEGDALQREGDPLLAQHDALVENEHRKQHPQIEEEHQELPRFGRGALLEAAGFRGRRG